MSSFVWPPEGSGGSSGVSSLNTLTGDITLAAGANITLTPSGNTLTIAASGGEGGTVTAVTASAPLASSGGATPNITVTGSALTEATSSVLTITGGTSALLAATSIQVKLASTSQSGYLSSTDWNTFNGKQATLTIGNLTDAGTDGIVVTGGIGAVIGSGTSIAQHVADTTHNGYLSSTDWNTFNGKGAGTVTAISVASANGFAGSSSGGATPALTLSTSITGILKGNATAISAATSGTDYSAGTSGLSTGILKSTTTTGALTIAIAADFPTLNQNTSGTAAGLSTTLVVGSGGTGLATLTSNNLLVGAGASNVTFIAPGTAGNVLTSNGTTFSSSAPLTGSYYQGFHTSAASWTVTNTAYTDPSVSGTATLTQRKASGLTVTTAGSNLPGITFTPAASTAIYLVTARVSLYGGTLGGVISSRLFDGTTVIAQGIDAQEPSASGFVDGVGITGIFAPGTASAVTLKIQIAASTGTANIFASGLGNTIEWTIIRIF